MLSTQEYNVVRGAYIHYTENKQPSVEPVRVLKETKHYIVVTSDKWVDAKGVYFNKRTLHERGVNSKYRYSKLIKRGT